MQSYEKNQLETLKMRFCVLGFAENILTLRAINSQPLCRLLQIK